MYTEYNFIIIILQLYSSNLNFRKDIKRKQNVNLGFDFWRKFHPIVFENMLILGGVTVGQTSLLQRVH